MKSRYIILLIVLLSLASCVSEDKLAMHDESSESEQVTAAAVEPVLDDTVPESSSTDTVRDTGTVPETSTASVVVTRTTLPGQYRIQPGDTFRTIAARPGIYWNETLWTNIYNANRDKIANPDLIFSGTMLLIPPLCNEIREGLWEANRHYENPFEAEVRSANTAVAATTMSANRAAPITNTRQTSVTAQASARTPTNSTLVRRNVVSCKIAGIERADEIVYITLEWAGLDSPNGEGTNVRIEAYTANNSLVGAIVLENSHSYGKWNRYFSVSGEFLTAYSSWNDRIDFATIGNNSIQIEHENIGSVFLRMELDGSPFRN
ncbi:MAG: LysM peptidoglycan-binding domain-containing protein [Treponema sp.]|jgi:hypothetical protein|nr:LysM peptidoglycan-binding domain-containing protein [Treponema sp.]